MKLKNIILSSAIAAAMMTGIAHAADNGEVQFMGAVSAKTCDIDATVDGAINNLVQLGTATANGGTSEKEFQLKLKDANACDLANLTSAFVTWNASSLNATGLANLNGTATDAKIELIALNAKVADTKVNSTANDVEFVPATVKADGFKFKAKLTGGATKGTVDTAAAFAVRYQ